jgi:hypothetical protein
MLEDSESGDLLRQVIDDRHLGQTTGFRVKSPGHDDSHHASLKEATVAAVRSVEQS